MAKTDGPEPGPQPLHPLLDEIGTILDALKGKDHGLDLTRLEALHQQHLAGCKALFAMKVPSEGGEPV